MESVKLKEVKHHKQLELCKNRPAYRQGRNLTAVKVYTVNSESQHLFIYNVPKINLRYELKNLCGKYGQVINIHVVPDYKTEIFTECYHVQFERIQSARIAKRLIDNKSFYGGVLHVCYAPEYESVKETKAKLLQRRKDVLRRLNADNEDFRHPKETQLNEDEKCYDSQQNMEGSSLKRQHNKVNKEEVQFPAIYSPEDPILKDFKRRKVDEGNSNEADRSVAINLDNKFMKPSTSQKKRILFYKK